MVLVRLAPIVGTCAAAFSAAALAADPAAASEGVPTMAAGVYTSAADVARCQAVWTALASGLSVRVTPPAKTLKLRARPATFRARGEREDADLQGMVSTARAPSCMLPFLVSAQPEKAPVFDRLTGLVWLGHLQQDPVAAREVANVPRQFNARKAEGFADWRVPTLAELASTVERSDFKQVWPSRVWGEQWSADRGPGCQWGMGPTATFEWCVPMSEKRNVQPVRTTTASAEPAPSVKAGPVASGAELGACQRAEWLKFVEGRAVPVTPRQPPAKLRAAPAELSAAALADRLGALNLYEDGRRCFVNDYHDAGGGTVVDAATGLEWEVGRSAKIMKWKEAQAHVQSLNAGKYLGHADWRLPTVEEAATLIESVQFLFPPTRVDPSVLGTSSFVWTGDLEPGRERAWVLATGSGRFSSAPTRPGVSPDDENSVKVVRSVR
jgi:hypothetical protein